MSIGPCPKVPARWPSVQFGLPRPAGAGSMKPKPDKGGDPAKCLSADSLQAHAAPCPADMDVCAHVRAHTRFSVTSPVNADGSGGSCCYSPTHPRPQSTLQKSRECSEDFGKHLLSPGPCSLWLERSRIRENRPQRQDGVMHGTAENSGVGGLVLSGII